jgi:two-component system, sensor histidine kinase PdtaS
MLLFFFIFDATKNLKKALILLLVFVIPHIAISQFNKAEFLSKYYATSIKGKIRLLATIPYADFKEVEPLLKDSIQLLKKQVYTNSENKTPRFLFDLIDLNRESYYQNFHKIIFISENSLSHHAQTFRDSLNIIEYMLPAYIKVRNLNKAFELNTLIEKNKYRIPKDTFELIATKKSHLYLLLGLPKEAIKYRHEEFIQSNSKTVNVNASYYNDIGVFFNKAKQPDSAIHYFNLAEKIIQKQLSQKPNDVFYQFYMGLIGGNKALSLTMKDKYEEAIPLLKKDVYYSLKSTNLESAANSYLLLVNCFLKLNQKEQAQHYLDSSEHLVVNIEELNPRVEFFKVKAEYYKVFGDSKNALIALSRHIALKDSSTNIEKEKQLLNQQISFDLYNKEQQLLDKEKIIEASKLTEARQKTFRAYLISGALMLIAIIVFLFMNNNLSKKRESELQLKNTQIWLQNQQIEVSLKEKELLIKEIHHRVKNNLQIVSSILSLQADKTNNEQITIILNDARQRIASMALTHQMLYQKQTLTSVSMKEYVETLIKQIADSYEQSHIELYTKIECETKNLDLDTAIPLGLLVNELLTNAYKHAFKGKVSGRISVLLNQTETNCTLTISDNGVGLPLSTEVNNNSLGMELIHILIDQLNCELTIDRANGTAFIIQLKK